MANRQHLLRALLIALLLLGGLGRAPGAAAQDPAAIPESYQLAAENDSFQLYVDRATLAFKVLDKRSGYLWHSGLDETQEGDRLNRSWTAFAQSGISIEYLDKKAVPKRISISNAERTVDVQPVEQGVAAQVAFPEVGISFEVILRLEEEGVSVEVPQASIKEENPDYKLGMLYLYPFLGATRGGSVPGYMFLPDGIGGLIPFADSTKAKNMFYGRYYGPDLGMLGTLPYDPFINRAMPISVPVFGLVHGDRENALLSIVEDGAAYGELHAHPAGIITNFNFIYNAFLYNQSYFQATNRSGAGVTTLQSATNAFDAKVHYRFLTGDDADYVGMARSYQQYLADRGVLRPISDERAAIGARLEFLGGDKEKVLLWDRFVPMTTLQQVRAILDDLAIAAPDVVYYGWQPLGASSMPPPSLKLERRLGSLAELRALAQDLASRGGHLALYLDPQAALRDEAGYSPRNDLATAITNADLLGYNRAKVNHYLNLDALKRRFSGLAAEIASQGAGLAVDGLGSTLYSDFKKGQTLNRQQASEAYQALLADQAGYLALYRPNDYMYGLMDAYYDMPLSGNGYTYIAETVPFLPIVLAGYAPYYGSPLNFSPNLQDDVLRHADFNMYPSFFLTQEPTAAMLNTPSNWIYTSSYAQWGEQIRATYRWLDERLGPVRGQAIVKREQLADGVFATTYANGLQVVVNYTARPFASGDIEVAAKDAILRQVEP